MSNENIFNCQEKRHSPGKTFNPATSRGGAGHCGDRAKNHAIFYVELQKAGPKQKSQIEDMSLNHGVYQYGDGKGILNRIFAIFSPGSCGYTCHLSPETAVLDIY